MYNTVESRVYRSLQRVTGVWTPVLYILLFGGKCSKKQDGPPLSIYRLPISPISMRHGEGGGREGTAYAYVRSCVDMDPSDVNGKATTRKKPPTSPTKAQARPRALGIWAVVRRRAGGRRRCAGQTPVGVVVTSSMSVYGKRATCTYQASRGVFSKSLASQPGRVQALTCLHADQDIEAGVTSWPDE